MTDEQVVQSIEELRSARHSVNPDEAWVLKTRAKMLQHIALTTEELPRRIFTLNHLWSALSLILPQKTVYAVVRPTVIFVVCFTVGTAGWITTVSASYASLPGDALYPVKIATEQTQAAVVEAIQGKAASAELHLSFASRRVDEVNKIIDAPGSVQDKQSRVDEAVKNLKNDVQSANQNLVSAGQDTPSAGAEVAKAIDRKVGEIKQTFETTGAHISSAATVAALDELRVEVDKAKLAVVTQPGVAATSTVGVTVVIVTTTPAVTTTESSVASSTATSAIFLMLPQLGLNTSTTAATTTPMPMPVRAIQHWAPAPKPDTSHEVINQPPVKDLPERPQELNSDVVDTATPIGLQSWGS